MRILDIIEGTIVDGPGLRTSIYFSGCSHKCPGCHNPESWDLLNGKEVSVAEILKVVRENDFNVTFSGGDPLFQVNDGLLELAQKIREEGKTIWCYTGYTIEEIRSSRVLRQVLDYIDVLVDGPFVEELRDESLLFRGSSNQRIIYLSPESRL